VKDIAEFGLRLAKAFASRSALQAELLKDADFRKAIHLRAKLRPDIGGMQAKLIAMGGRPKTTGERRHGSAVFLPAQQMFLWTLVQIAERLLIAIWMIVKMLK
jgi:hypothetical protein